MHRCKSAKIEITYTVEEHKTLLIKEKELSPVIWEKGFDNIVIYHI